MLRLIKRTIWPLPTELDKCKGIIQRVWDGPQVNTSERRSSSPRGWVQETAYWLSLTGFISFTASQFYFSRKKFQCPWAATKWGALSPFFNIWSLGETWLSTDLKGSSLWNANTQPNVTHFASMSSRITQLLFHSVTDAIRDLLLRMQKYKVHVSPYADVHTCASKLTDCRSGSSVWGLKAALADFNPSVRPL